MCGIVGYLGEKNPKDVIISGLRRLEYRGYDSSGIAVLDHGKIQRVRALGKLKALEDKLSLEPLFGSMGIGHTRWATHGAPSEINAHPHTVGGVTLVHNGIIENYQEIRQDLIHQGCSIQSETDSELVAHLLSLELKNTPNLKQAAEKVRAQLRGAYAILVLWVGEPDHLLCFKNGPPLVLGLGEGENFVASDVQALLQYTQKFIYLDDDEMALLGRNKIEVFDLHGKTKSKKVTELNWDPETVEKQGFSHFMLKEIYEQARAVASAMAPHIHKEEMMIRLGRVGFGTTSVSELALLDQDEDWKTTKSVLYKTERIFIVACGTSFYAATYAKYLIENLAQIPVEIDVASEFRYRNPLLIKNTLFITISQSGETADTLAAIRKAKEMGAVTLSICNVANSSIDREAHGHLYMNSGPEIGVASTKAFTSTLMVMNCFALSLAKIKGVLPTVTEKELVRELLQTPSLIETVLAYDKFFNEASEFLKKFKGFLYLGRGVNFPIAMEGALKLKELAYLHAEGYAAGEMKHGPLALIDSEMAILVLAPQDPYYEKTLSNLEEAKARGGEIISIGTVDDEKLHQVSHQFLGIPKCHWMISPILEVIPLQLMAFHLADRLGHDVDQPRNLAKSVTVE
ncbi:MAG TPA: glutamine--fructose-6-phosphate transaminase (isomerizing) [Pseudobdellovibrionaceae bacterium]|nr:glutamine--fructose-6-phosphate transaminase (isomerizing) [Pseudobdellovibrionaceae bacterium]